MRYLLLIHSDEAAWQALSDEEKAPAYQRYRALADEMRERGHLVGGDELAPPESAKLVRSTPGGPTVLDGPFAETKEQLGGYFLVECELDTAIDYAARIPAAEHGTIEVRAVADEPEPEA